MKLVFAGTSDARKFALSLAESGEKIIVCTATRYGASFYPKHKNIVRIYDYPMNANEMERIVKQESVDIIVDATHPYAVNVSSNIKKAGNKAGIPVKTVYRESDLQDDILEQLIRVSDYQNASDYLKYTSGRILLTIGSNNLEYFTIYKLLDRLVVRVLPTVDSIKKCITLGLSPKQIIAMQGPFSKDINQVIFNDYHIDYIVTKDSGKEGGVIDKISAALESELKVVLIERPNKTNKSGDK